MQKQSIDNTESLPTIKKKKFQHIRSTTFDSSSKATNVDQRACKAQTAMNSPKNVKVFAMSPSMTEAKKEFKKQIPEIKEVIVKKVVNRATIKKKI